MTDSVYVGNAGKDAALDRGWLLGHFKDASDPRHSEAVEIKWGVHPRGDERAPRRLLGGRVRQRSARPAGHARHRVRHPGRAL
ncbi:signal peptidase I, partial [Streptomyces aureus]